MLCLREQVRLDQAVDQVNRVLKDGLDSLDQLVHQVTPDSPDLAAINPDVPDPLEDQDL